MTLVWRPGYGGAAVSDPDAMAYLRLVEEADNQALEQGVQQAVNQFVIGCKADGIWTAIKASCILAGARTLSGALIPLVGAAPTNVGPFVSGDYNRKTGLTGNTSNKSLLAGTLANALGNQSHHIFLNGSQFPTSGENTGWEFAGVYDGTSLSSILDIWRDTRASVGANITNARSGSSNGPSYSANGITSGSLACSRIASTDFRLFYNGISVGQLSSGVNPSLPAIRPAVFAINQNGTQIGHTAFTCNLFTFGNGLSTTAMQSLHTRVTALITAIGAAIP